MEQGAGFEPAGNLHRAFRQPPMRRLLPRLNTMYQIVTGDVKRNFRCES
jgi:hypothetical protein